VTRTCCRTQDPVPSYRHPAPAGGRGLCDTSR
jgi:hypothetical protein